MYIVCFTICMLCNMSYIIYCNAYNNVYRIYNIVMCTVQELLYERMDVFYKYEDPDTAITQEDVEALMRLLRSEPKYDAFSIRASETRLQSQLDLF